MMNLLAKDLWREVQGAFRCDRGAAVVDLWLKNSRPLGFAKGVFQLGVPNEVVRTWIEHRYRQELEQIFRRLTGSPVRVVTQVDATLRVTQARQGAASDGPVADDRLDGAPERSERAERAGPAGPAPFLVRPENRLAHAALQRVLSDPASGNPLFLYGPAGAGKSLLIRHLLRRDREESGVLRNSVSITAETFTQDVVRAVKENTLAAFRGRMLAADVFVLDEAHRLRGRSRTQRELLSIIQYHVARRRPVVLASRHSPNAVFLLDEGLRSYFLSGILLRMADYSNPSRVAILTSLAEHFVRPVPAATIERVVERVTGDLAQQARFLEKVAAWAGLHERPAALEFVGPAFPELAGGGGREPDFQKLVELVAQELGTTAEEIASNRKVRRTVAARHLVVYLATEVFNFKARRVMRHLGGLSPSTTAYARRRVEERRRLDPLFDLTVRRVQERLQGGQRMLF